MEMLEQSGWMTVVRNVSLVECDGEFPQTFASKIGHATDNKKRGLAPCDVHLFDGFDSRASGKSPNEYDCSNSLRASG